MIPASFNPSDTKLTRSSIPLTLPQFERLIISAAVSAKVQSRTGAAMSHHAPIDVHAHYFPRTFLDLIAQHGPSRGFEYKMVEGKGPQFRHGHLVTGPVGPKFVDLEARLAAMDEQGVEVHALSLSQPMVYWRREISPDASARPTTTRSRRRTSGIRSGSWGSRRCRCTSPCSRSRK